jgi:hypothetical protein
MSFSFNVLSFKLLQAALTRVVCWPIKRVGRNEKRVGSRGRMPGRKEKFALVSVHLLLRLFEGVGISSVWYFFMFHLCSFTHRIVF